MKKKILLPALLQLCILISFAQVKIQHLLTENLTNPIGIDVKQPRFSWQLVSDKKNVTQSAYEIIVLEKKTPVWKSGKITSSQSVQISYAGIALQSGKIYTWKLKLWDNNEKVSSWSEAAFFKQHY